MKRCKPALESFYTVNLSLEEKGKKAGVGGVGWGRNDDFSKKEKQSKLADALNGISCCKNLLAQWGTSLETNGGFP